MSKKIQILKIIGITYSNADLPTALKQSTDILANKDLKGIFATNEPAAICLGKVIENKGLSGKIVAVGFD